MNRLVLRRGRPSQIEALAPEEVKTRTESAPDFAKKAARKAVINQRREAYGSAEQQLEFLAENGIEAFIARQAEIKARHPLPPPADQPKKRKARGS